MNKHGPAFLSRHYVDPVTLEIVRNGMKSIAERVTRRMIRASNSFLVKEMEDCSSSLLDADGQLIAEEAGPPIQLNTVGICLKTILKHVCPKEAWNPGDVIITNDPYIADGSLAATHTNDYIAFSPVFFDGDLVAFAGSMVHHIDIGAMNMGTRGWNREVFQEGVRVPPMKIIDGGVMNRQVLDVILRNSRLPETLENDLLAQFSSVDVAVSDIRELFIKYGKSTMLSVFAELMDQSEAHTRKQIALIPDGVYQHEEVVLDDGAMGGPHKLRLTLTKRESDVILDFTGTDKQVEGPINSPLATTYAAVYYAMRCITDPSISGTEGCKRPISIIAPSGSLVNAQLPAAVMQRMVVCHSLVDLIIGALASAVPDRVMGDSCGCQYNFAICDDRSGRRTMFGEVVPGGIGATAIQDGINAVTCHVANTHIPPIEAMEVEEPVRYLRRALQVDAAGAGKYRGGTGYIISYQVLGENPMLHRTSQKSVSQPQGVNGGRPGRGGKWVINEGKGTERVLEFAIGDIEKLDKDDTVTFYTPAGGGFGEPRERDPKLVRRDVEYGYITKEHALEIYGVHVD